MTTPHTPLVPARPCSSPARPNPGDDHGVSGRPGLSPPTGTTRHTESDDDHPTDRCSSHPEGTTTTITAHCPTHGRQTFIHNPAGDLWFCPHLLTFPNDQPIVGCWSVILAEDVTPDGADVTQLLRRGVTS